MPNTSISSVWAPVREQEQSARARWRTKGYFVYLVLLTLVFTEPLTRLGLYAFQNQLHSYVVLVPLICGYLLYLERMLSLTGYGTSIGGAFAMGGIGTLVLAASMIWHSSLSSADRLDVMALAFVCLVWFGGFFFLGSRWMASHAFSMAFFIFLVPLPDAAVNSLERASVLGSAEAAALFFNLMGTPVSRHGVVFELPGIVLQVAQECSGIRSSWVLFITSLLAAHLFLKTRWRKMFLVGFVIPLGIVRNGFRIAVIGLLCVHIGPEMIDSPIHHRGGPLFFVLSLIPLFLVVWWLRRQERCLKLPS